MDRPVTGSHATAAGRAQAGLDYLAGSGALTFPAGETVLEITVGDLDHPLDEPDETFTLDLTAPGGRHDRRWTGPRYDPR